MTIPRHRFAPEAPLTEEYAAQNTITTKRDAEGVSTSSTSAPMMSTAR